MSTAAVIMMIVAILVVWGGLVVAIVNLNRSPSAVPDVDEVHRDL
ncbi:MAG: methionine/alanine import family NSS transporter small subunit [Nocardioides sp.]|nr:methionine/alanine import family NSS transporter small subunit [Nocardioides sp.]